MLMPESFLVIVRCMTFNHHAYIEDAMNGFCMQKTDFPYLCIVMDDCSTDGEQEVIKKYVAEYFNSITNEETDDSILNICQHKTNENCYFAVFYLKYNHYSIKKDKVPYYARWQDKCKYVALCEGDDYWIAADKLQMQADFLEENEKYSMVFHSAIQHWEDGSKPDAEFKKIENREYSAKEILKEWTIPTASVIFRRHFIQTEFYCNLIKDMRFIFGDILVFLTMCKEGKIYGINKTLSVYRRHEGSAVYGFSFERVYKQYFHLKAIADYFPDLEYTVKCMCIKWSSHFCVKSLFARNYQYAKKFYCLDKLHCTFLVPLYYLCNIIKWRQIKKQ
ncbi:MAG: hypothetical protein IKO56_06740 [Alphaproteobacteria bacterium]|nr:hypothetical protein [Alphaproteobacteria bacterium]